MLDITGRTPQPSGIRALLRRGTSVTHLIAGASRVSPPDRASVTRDVLGQDLNPIAPQTHPPGEHRERSDVVLGVE